MLLMMVRMMSLSFAACLYLLQTAAVIQLPFLPLPLQLRYPVEAYLLSLDQRCRRYLGGLVLGAAEVQTERQNSKTQIPHI